jgi:hypothetical protein
VTPAGRLGFDNASSHASKVRYLTRRLRKRDMTHTAPWLGMGDYGRTPWSATSPGEAVIDCCLARVFKSFSDDQTFGLANLRSRPSGAG